MTSFHLRGMVQSVGENRALTWYIELLNRVYYLKIMSHLPPKIGNKNLEHYILPLAESSFLALLQFKDRVWKACMIKH